jgi:hypothetical protein
MLHGIGLGSCVFFRRALLVSSIALGALTTLALLPSLQPQVSAQEAAPAGPEPLIVDPGVGEGNGTQQGSPEEAPAIAEPAEGTSEEGEAEAAEKEQPSEDAESKEAIELAPDAEAQAMMASTISLPDGAGTEGLPKASSVSPESLAAGAFTQKIEIAVPAFHGIEPSISLEYESGLPLTYSGDGNGWLGVGWRLRGIPVIERGVRGGGAPRFDANDVYFLSGEEMIACVAGMTNPSCASGGTHATRTESYRKIVRNTTTNIWSVFAKDGTKYEFRAVSETRPPDPGDSADELNIVNNYRWLLRTVTDTNANVVTYNYGCGAKAYCRIQEIIYGAARVNFTWETRPDSISYANGIYVTDKPIAHRVKTVAVRFNNSLVRAYALGYSTSTRTARSLLTSVQQFGTDASIAGDGAVTAGATPPLPPTIFTYEDGAAAFGTPVLWVKPEMGEPPPSPNAIAFGDFDGNGIREAATFKETAGVHQIILTSLSNVITAFNVNVAHGDFVEADRLTFIRAADFGADGKDDIFITAVDEYGAGNSETRVKQFVFYGPTFTQRVVVNVEGVRGEIGDFNGDGRADIKDARDSDP